MDRNEVKKVIMYIRLNRLQGDVRYFAKACKCSTATISRLLEEHYECVTPKLLERLETIVGVLKQRQKSSNLRNIG